MRTFFRHQPLIKKCYITIFLQLSTFYAVYAWENPTPAALLQPRDFNPHPYRKDKAFLIAPFDENNHFQDKQNDRELLRRFQKFAIIDMKNSLRNLFEFLVLDQ